MRRSLPLIAVGLALAATQVRAQLPQTEPPFLQAFLFGDALFTVSDVDAPDGFKLGQMVAHGNATLSDHVVFFGELSISARSSGYVLAMERAILRYDFDDPLKLSVGRYHTPISYWNTAFHHGLWLQGSVARPEFVKFGSRYVPVHFVGAMAEGNLDRVPLYYAVGFGNGRSDNIAGAGDAGDVNGSRAFVASASIRPRRLFGFRVGGAVYVDRISSPGGPELADEQILNGYVVWDRGPVEAIAEYTTVAHKELGTDVTTKSPSYYGHLGYRLPGTMRDLMPYIRYENMDIDAADVVFTGQVSDYDAVVAGIRYDFDDFAALKAEYRSEKVAGGSRTDSYFVQASFAVPVSGGS